MTIVTDDEVERVTAAIKAVKVARFAPITGDEELEARAALAASDRDILVADWQPIETAPKKGRYLFAYEETVFLGEWSEYSSSFEPEYAEVPMYDDGDGPTHWMPIPQAPAALTPLGGGGLTSVAPSPDPVSPPSTQP